MGPLTRPVVALVLATVLAALLLRGLGPVQAVEVETISQSVKRDILALYDSKAEGQIRETRIHKYAEMPLDYLGFKLTYWDVNTPLPSPDELRRFRGVLTWFIEPLAAPGPYLDWIDRATDRGLPLVVFSELAPPNPVGTEPIARRVWNRLGLTPTSSFINVTTASKISSADAGMIGFERPIDKALPPYLVMLADAQATEVRLAIDTPLRSGRAAAALVTTSKSGGFVSDNYSVFYEPNTDRVLWSINPFAFFKATFGRDRMPIPDVTTLSGRRMYFSQIDGDGWNNVTEIERFQADKLLSSEVIEREVIKPYPDLPVSVGVIGGDVDLRLGGTPQSIGVARRLFALPQVEVASHTYTHPFDWSFFEHYDRRAELKIIDEFQRAKPSLVDTAKDAVASLATSSGAVPHRHNFGGVPVSNGDLPRAYMVDPFDLTQDIREGLAIAESLAPPGKRAPIVQWSGNCVPFEAAVKLTRDLKVLNINGGDARLDKDYPSVTYIPPISRTVGSQRQIYAVNSNENTYTNDWLGPFFGFFLLDQTLDNTERPRRLKPFDLYYHMYSGQKPAALAAIRHFNDRARRSPVIPVTTSTYARIADDFFSVSIEQLDVLRWAVADHGELSTLRFDDADDLDLDLRLSQGVLGATRKADQHALYVALDKAVPRAIVALSRRASPTPASQSPAAEAASVIGLEDHLAALESARWRVYDRAEAPCRVDATMQGFGPGEMRWQTMPNRSFRISATRGETTLAEEIVRSGPDGMLSARLDLDAIKPLHFRLECDD